MAIDLPDVTSFVLGLGTFAAAITALLRLLIGNAQKKRAGVASANAQRDKDLIRERDSLKRELAHTERQLDTEHRNANRTLDRWVEARRKVMETYGKDAADQMFGETPKMEQTLSYDEMRAIRQRHEEPPAYY